MVYPYGGYATTGLLRWRLRSGLGFLLDSLNDLKDFGVWTTSKVLQDGVYQVG
jgi:hypothetical protein